MAKKTTKAAEAVNEEVKNVTEPVVEEAKIEEEVKASEPAEEPVAEAAPAEEPVAEETQNPAEEEAPAEEPALEEAPVEEAPVVEGEPVAEADAPVGLTNDGTEAELDVKEITEQFANPEERLNNLGLTEENKETVVKEELEKVEEIEKKLSEDIKKTEAALPKEKKDFAQKIFRYGFGDFWNGVTETI